MSEENAMPPEREPGRNGFSAKGWWGEISTEGRSATIVVVVFVAALTVGGIVWAGQQRDEAHHTDLRDAVEALLWVNLPPEYRDRTAPPKWVRQRLDAGPVVPPAKR